MKLALITKVQPVFYKDKVIFLFKQTFYKKYLPTAKPLMPPYGQAPRVTVGHTTLFSMHFLSVDDAHTLPRLAQRTATKVIGPRRARGRKGCGMDTCPCLSCWAKILKPEVVKLEVVGGEARKPDAKGHVSRTAQFEVQGYSGCSQALAKRKALSPPLMR